jgi:uncharacterized protein (DUF2235 family)
LNSTAGRKLVVCCDGTWNRPYQVGGPTNVVKMVRAILPIDPDGASQLVYYHAGVGTGNLVDVITGGVVGIGLGQNVQDAYEFLVNNFVDGDRIYLFGFSRGAYTARSLAGLIASVRGLLEKRDMDLFPFVWRIYRSKRHRATLGSRSRARVQETLADLFSGRELGMRRARLTEALLHNRPTLIFFIGVWDTVGALGAPFGALRWVGRSRYDFHDTELSSRIEFAYQALAIDETRRRFVPCLWARPVGRDTEIQTLEQVWFAGSHSNVGGGYKDAGLSDIALLWMVDRACSAQPADEGKPLAVDIKYLKESVAPKIGDLVDARRWFWKVWREYRRPIMKTPAAGWETCEAIHWSARVRYECTEPYLFVPAPYRPRNLAGLPSTGGRVAAPSSLERECGFGLQD